MKQNRDLNGKELQIAVPCPAWLQKRILQNMCKAAMSRFNAARAEKAASLLATLNAESTTIPSQTQLKPAKKRASTDKDLVKQGVQPLGARLRRAISNVIRNFNRIWDLARRVAVVCVNLMRQSYSAPTTPSSKRVISQK